MYRITLRRKNTYTFDSSLYTPEQAMALARDFFEEAETDVDFEALAPCEIDGKCPHADGNCSLCR